MDIEDVPGLVLNTRAEKILFLNQANAESETKQITEQ